MYVLICVSAVWTNPLSVINVIPGFGTGAAMMLFFMNSRFQYLYGHKASCRYNADLLLTAPNHDSRNNHQNNPNCAQSDTNNIQQAGRDKGGLINRLSNTDPQARFRSGQTARVSQIIYYQLIPPALLSGEISNCSNSGCCGRASAPRQIIR